MLEILSLNTHEVQNYQPVGSEQLRDKNGPGIKMVINFKIV